jgi:hypothetical protein
VVEVDECLSLGFWDDGSIWERRVPRSDERRDESWQFIVIPRDNMSFVALNVIFSFSIEGREGLEF